MTTAILSRPFDGHEVRTVVIRGEPWWVAKDVAEILGYRDAANLARRIDEEDRGTHIMSTPSGDQPFSIINESGLYTAILGSNKHEAKAFKRWIVSEILPSIRRTGRYEVGQSERKKSAQIRTDLTAAWKARGADKQHHYINLTRAEYKGLGYGNGMGVHKEDFSREELLRLSAFESLEALKLERNPQISGYHELAASVLETAHHLPILVDQMIARRLP